MISHITLVLFLLVLCNSCVAKLSPHCKRLVTKDHLKNLSDLIDTQMKSSCEISFNYVEESDLNHPVCFLKAAYRPLGHLLRNEMKFKENTANSRIQDMLLESHVNLDEECFKTKADESQSSAHCIKKFSLSAEEMLELVRRYFNLAAELIFKEEDFSQDCSKIFRKCSDSQNEAAVSSGVVTDQDCKCPATSPITRGLVTSFLPTFESLPSITDQLDSKETAASTLQLSMLPGTMQTQGQSEGSTRPRVSRSTYKGPSLDAEAAAYAAMSSAPEELVLATMSPGPDPVVMDTAAFQDLTLTLLPWSPRPSNIPPFPASQQQTKSMGTESALPGSGAGSIQVWPKALPSQHLSLSGLDKASPSNRWLQQIRDVAKAIPGLPYDSDRTDSSSTSSLSLESFATLEPLDSSGVPSSGSWAVLPPSDPALFPILGSEEPFSTTRQSFRASPRQISPDSYSWGEQSSRGQAPRIQLSTQLRERRAGRGEEGLAKDREPEDSLSGPNFDLRFVPLNTDKSSKKPELRDSQRMTLVYVLVPSVLGILLAVGGLLFYLHKSRMLARRRQQRMGSDMEEQEGSPLRGGDEHLELQMQGEL
ncbi:PREDICTED: macrophage colony-stimulating factor 1 [Gekko japonicus]|uniref:Macrophage colony-stimulating factor 1 n=1 Tax=Gekko japonicus TaxID=146911 RepID=A0ABM1JKQ3_GEKJA|nr:PREDICTED: macrophage colony-stimulating factor 1 [Gekko japonicus]